MAGGLMAMGCGSSSTAAPSSTTGQPAHYAGSPLSWLTSEAGSWNKTLNNDQVLVDTASKNTNRADASTYFAHLALACTRLRNDALQAQQVQTAPSPALASAWRAMTIHTESYASDCLTLTRTRSNTSFNRWNQSLKTMDLANTELNTAVAAVRGKAGPSGPVG